MSAPRTRRGARRAARPFGALGVALASALASLPSPASANVAASRHEPSTTGPVVIAGKTALRVTDEQLSFDCHPAGDGDAACDFEARYRFENPSAAREEAIAAFMSEGATGVTLELDGKPASHALAPEEASAIGKAAAPDAPREGGLPPDSEGALRAQFSADSPSVVLAAEPGTRHELVVRGRLPAGYVFQPRGYAYDAILARHPALAREPAERRYPFRYALWPMRSWADDPTIHLKVRFPSGWEFMQAGDGWSVARDGGARVATKDVKLSAAGADLSIDLRDPPSPIVPGGVILGLGGSTGAFSGFRARFGYELALPRDLLWSLTLDANFKGTAFVTPTATLASPALWFIPSFGIGVGLPVQIAPERRVGARVQLDVQMYILGFVMSLDVFPRKDGDPLTQATFLAQVTF